MPKPSSQHQTLHNRRYSDFWRRRKNQVVAGLLITCFSLIVLVGIIYLIRNGTSYKVTYNGDALVRVFPKSERDRIFLEKFETLNLDAQVWGLPTSLSAPVFIYVKTGSMHRLERIFQARNLTFTVLIEDVQDLINREDKSINERRSEHSADEGFDFANYHPLEEIENWLNDLPKVSPLVNLSSMNKTYENRDLLLVSISNGPITRYDSMGHPEEKEKPVIYINCGIHAREWVTVSTCLWFIDQLTDVNNTDASQLLNTFDFWIVPVANPDGYVYTWTSDRMWRKNRTPNDKCAGVDLNRNFDIGFNDTSRNGCSNSYGGPTPESEIETVTLIQLLSSAQHRIKATLFIHSFSQLWLSPYGYQTASLPADYSEMERVMSKAVSALQAIYRTEYQYGSVANVLYSAPGTAIDYCYEKLGIVHSYTAELRDTGKNAFMLPIEEIIPTAIETWEGVKAMAEAIKENLPLRFFH